MAPYSPTDLSAAVSAADEACRNMHGTLDVHALATHMSRHAQRTAYPQQLTSALAGVLGMPNFLMRPIWMALRETGQNIAPRYEDEMAAALHFLIPIVIEHGDGWQRAAADRLLALQTAHEASTEKGPNDGR
ncbi:hypothetical protein [Sphingomonas aquatilis]|uniref:hypothetical protein n=1 Tax=Sphingomonas aquatilis TaxID=93063 RepID=UPI0023F622BF|nr:hypothetical protein [Sphingomonas aquatilis]MCI4653095.1 hypothetical protein [Sphingomonas aquatilis]